MMMLSVCRAVCVRWLVLLERLALNSDVFMTLRAICTTVLLMLMIVLCVGSVFYLVSSWLIVIVMRLLT